MCVELLVEVSRYDKNKVSFDTNFHKNICLKCGPNKYKGELLQFTKCDMRHFEILVKRRNWNN